MALPLQLRLLPLFLAFTLGPLPAWSQGSLNPAGPPGPSGRSLDQIEPRIPINATGPFPFAITQKGSYYLTGNITVAAGNAIVVQASDVNLDLNGFTISSTSPTLSGQAILLDSAAASNVSIGNGFIRGTTTYNQFTNAYSGGGFAVGVGSTLQSTLAPTGVRVSSLGVSGVGDGIQLNPLSPSNVVEKTTVASVSGAGIRAGVVADSSADRTGGIAVESRSASNVAGSRTTPGDAVLPLTSAPLTTADVEAPRSAIAGGTATVTISAPGSYFLTGNLTVASGNGITITADNVSLDLNGYTISSTAAAPTGVGVHLSGGRSNIAIANGHIRGTRVYSGGTFSGGGFQSGIDYSTAPRSVRVSNVSVSGVGGFGIDLGSDRASSIVGCTVRTAGTLGLQAGVVADSAALEIGSTSGIQAGTVSNVYCTLTGAGTPVAALEPSVPSVSAQVSAVQTTASATASGVTALQATADPRIGIPGGSTPYVISAPGSYVLRGNLTVASGNAITIAANNVTLDLSGFTISSTSATASGDAVNLNGRSGVTIFRGTIVSGSAASGSTFTAGSGFQGGINYSTTPTNVRVSDVTVIGVSQYGIDLGTDGTCVVSHCIVRLCGTYGIRAGTITDSTAVQCGLSQAPLSATTIANCTGSNVGASVTAFSSLASSASVTSLQTGLNTANTNIGTANTSLANLQSTANSTQTAVNTVNTNLNTLTTAVDQLEPRTQIPGGTGTYTISTSGSYILTGHRSVASGHAIVITASYVTLDLNGFAITGNQASPAAGAGISVASNLVNVTLRNGHIRGGTTLSGTTFSGNGLQHGIDAAITENLRVEQISVYGVAGYGINARGVSSNVRNCTVRVSADTGIAAEVVESCQAQNCGNFGIVADSSVSQSKGSAVLFTGILCPLVSHCEGRGVNSGISASESVSHSLGVASVGAGIEALSAVVSYSQGRSTGGGAGVRGGLLVACKGSGSPNTFGTPYLMP